MNNSKKLHSSSRSLLCTFNKNLFTLETSRNTVFVYGPGWGGGGGGALLGTLGGAVPLGSSNSDPISDQKVLFFAPVVRPNL